MLFCCVDSLIGRSVCERIARACVIPLFDLGVTIPIKETKEGDLIAADMCVRIDYVQPDGSNLSDRKVITPEGLRTEYLRATSPEKAAEEEKKGYIDGVPEEAPSVINLNMVAAAKAYNEWVIRQFSLFENNKEFASIRSFLFSREEEHTSEDEYDCNPQVKLGQGLASPLLGFPALEDERKKLAS